MKKKKLKKLLKQLQSANKKTSPLLTTWLDIYEQQMLEKGYKQQTVRNRTAVIGHIRRTEVRRHRLRMTTKRPS